MCRSILLGLLLEIIVLSRLTGAIAAETPVPRPLLQAHAHNDYLHKRPLLDAIEHGFCGVEADVFLVNGELLVAHTPLELRPERTLQKLYLDPLRTLARDNGGRVYRNGPTLTLLIDIKADPEASYAALAKVLAQYGDIVSCVREGQFEQKAVTAIVSGERPWKTIAADSVRYVGIDGRLTDLESTAPPDLLPLISDHWGRNFRWTGDGPMPEAERSKLQEVVAKAHDRGRRVRFWATPERVEVWRELRAAGVDLINTDDLAGLQQFLTEPAAP